MDKEIPPVEIKSKKDEKESLYSIVFGWMLVLYIVAYFSYGITYTIYSILRSD